MAQDQDEIIRVRSRSFTAGALFIWSLTSIVPLIFGINLLRQGFALGGLIVLAVVAIIVTIARSSGNFLRIPNQGAPREQGLTVRTAFRLRTIAWSDIEEFQIWERSSRQAWYRVYRVGVVIVFSRAYLAQHRLSSGCLKIRVDRTPAELEDLVLKLIRLRAKWGGKA